MRALSTVLASAFAPRWLPAPCLVALERVFAAVLSWGQRRGIVAYLPCRAVAVLTPPRPRPWLIANQLARLGCSCWCLSNCAAWPTGEGAGTMLLTQLCDLADRSGVDLCLRASNERSRDFYRRCGFQPTAGGRGLHATVMIRYHRPAAPTHAEAGSESIILSGRLEHRLASRLAASP